MKNNIYLLFFNKYISLHGNYLLIQKFKDMKSIKLIRRVNSALGIFKWLAILAGVITIATFVMNASGKYNWAMSVDTPYTLSDNQVNQLISEGAHLKDFRTYKISHKSNIEPFSMWGIMSLIGMLLFIALIIYGIITLQKILTNASIDSPFTMENVRLIRRLALLVFGYAVFSWTGGVFNNLMSLRLNPQQEPAMVDVNLGTGNFQLLLFGFLILILAAVFQKGVELKEESELTI